MKPRKVYIAVYQKVSGIAYVRIALTKKENLEGAYMYFEINSEATVKDLNEIWGMEVYTKHPDLIDWKDPFFPLSIGYLAKGIEGSKEIELNEDNFDKWVEELDRISKPFFGNNFGSSISKAEWIEMYFCDTPEECLRNEILAAT